LKSPDSEGEITNKTSSFAIAIGKQLTEAAHLTRIIELQCTARTENLAQAYKGIIKYNLSAEKVTEQLLKTLHKHSGKEIERTKYVNGEEISYKEENVLYDFLKGVAKAVERCNAAVPGIIKAGGNITGLELPKLIPPQETLNLLSEYKPLEGEAAAGLDKAVVEKVNLLVEKLLAHLVEDASKYAARIDLGRYTPEDIKAAEAKLEEYQPSKEMIEEIVTAFFPERSRTDSGPIATAASANTSTKTVTSEYTQHENDEVVSPSDCLPANEYTS
jgi:hypothetical protein